MDKKQLIVNYTIIIFSAKVNELLQLSNPATGLRKVPIGGARAKRLTGWASRLAKKSLKTLFINGLLLYFAGAFFNQ
ncbi:MAG: hypothetical protein IPN20_10945 [Haliscomenobacter sp.]|nr:hypothetical protein [Haliscomenobacter sp.]MBK8654400.1 hypothetical protein [Haliscomenobacter sp.]